MKTISDYTIYCTSEQAKKAFELGAPIMTFGYPDLEDAKEEILKMNRQAELYQTENGGIMVGQIPTAEQMIGFLRSKGFRFKITDFKEGTIWRVVHGDWLDFNSNDGINPKEATLAAIDAALEYLTNKK